MRRISTTKVLAFTLALFITPSFILAQAIPDNTPAGIDIVHAEPSGNTVVSVTLDADITHTWVGDLIITITSPDGTTASVLTRPGASVGSSFGCSANDMSITIEDGGADGSVEDCSTTSGDPAYTGTSYSPFPDAFAGFVGENTLTEKQGLKSLVGVSALGNWTMNVSDNAGGDTGSINSLVLNIESAPLPVELSDFAVSIDDGAANLSWTTLSETNNAGFEIQSKLAGDSNEFATIAYVQGAGTTTEANDYSFVVDQIEFGTHLFRLKQIDFDGSSEYSETVEVSNELVDGYALRDFYPNPFNPQGQFGIMVAEDQNVDIAVYNLMGQRVASLFNGELLGQEWHQFTLNASTLPSGNYLITSRGATFASTQKVLLVK